MKTEESATTGSDRSLGKFMGDLLRQKSSDIRQDFLIVADNAKRQSDQSTPPSPLLEKSLARKSSRSSFETDATVSTCNASAISLFQLQDAAGVRRSSASTFSSNDDDAEDNDDENDRSCALPKGLRLPVLNSGLCKPENSNSSLSGEVITSTTDVVDTVTPNIGPKSTEDRWHPLTTSDSLVPVRDVMVLPQCRITHDPATRHADGTAIHRMVGDDEGDHYERKDAKKNDQVQPLRASKASSRGKNDNVGSTSPPPTTLRDMFRFIVL